MKCTSSFRERGLYSVGMALVLVGVLGCATTTTPETTPEVTAPASGETADTPAQPAAREPTAGGGAEDEKAEHATRVGPSPATGRVEARAGAGSGDSAEKILELEGRLQSLQAIPSSASSGSTPSAPPVPTGRF